MQLWRFPFSQCECFVKFKFVVFCFVAAIDIDVGLVKTAGWNELRSYYINPRVR
jgi:hypothetical protein